MVRAIPTRMLYTLIIRLWIPPCDSSNGLRNLYYYITGRFFTSRALGNASACPSPPAPLGDLYQIVIKKLPSLLSEVQKGNNHQCAGYENHACSQ